MFILFVHNFVLRTKNKRKKTKILINLALLCEIKEKWPDKRERLQYMKLALQVLYIFVSNARYYTFIYQVSHNIDVAVSTNH